MKQNKSLACFRKTKSSHGWISIASWKNNWRLIRTSFRRTSLLRKVGSKATEAAIRLRESCNVSIPSTQLHRGKSSVKAMLVCLIDAKGVLTKEYFFLLVKLLADIFLSSSEAFATHGETRTPEPMGKGKVVSPSWKYTFSHRFFLWPLRVEHRGDTIKCQYYVYST